VLKNVITYYQRHTKLGWKTVGYVCQICNKYFVKAKSMEEHICKVKKPITKTE
jgi:hypothetical protein